ncbi:hypothetical protein EN780_05750 [Mesorhizobium sp. M4B.F.Ca.ET.089.01.1.1]|uniref:hypothetical protein n=1 Tax=Mesorhizobium sp. M4B.F.Ca.ET.089.01.1.1 TaxID=2496662 RepID=UPI000FE36733|nr:hypothetical protein [Mesorhizobium sp. M4B.F.Ca.ET.089.01.1.1]RWX69626.1 hypothetical protein EN780_05750 [Mesorhizobium sp. M4B.F.Ca.ET.089.01.1.1]
MFGSNNHAFAPETDAGMLGHGIADPDQIEILAKAVSDYCARHRIVADDERERIAIKVMCLFRRGVIEPLQLSEELERVR